MNPDPTTDPAGYVLAVAEEREQGASDASWESAADFIHRYGHMFLPEEDRWVAAEANPKHALAEVALWRAIAEEHEEFYRLLHAAGSTQPKRPDILLLRAVAAAKAYDQTKELG